MSEETSKKLHAVGYLYDAVVGTMTAQILRTTFGYTMNYEMIAADAIAHIKEADMVISDVSKGGYDVYNAARAHNKPIIMIDGGFLEANRTPEAVVIPKPFTLSQLEQAVRKCAEGLKPNTQQ